MWYAPPVRLLQGRWQRLLQPQPHSCRATNLGPLGHADQVAELLMEKSVAQVLRIDWHLERGVGQSVKQRGVRRRVFRAERLE